VIQVIARGLEGMSIGWDASLALDSAGRPHLAYYDAAHGGLWYAQDLGAAWRFEPIDPAANNFASLSLGPGDTPHVAYCLYGCAGLACYCQQVRYAQRDGPVWVTETLRFGLMGEPALDVDAAGRPHLAYAVWSGDTRQSRLLYSFHDGTGWISETVAEGVDAPSLALDAAGQPHVGYLDLWKDEVRYAVRGIAGWCAEVVDREVNGAAAATRLALDAAGRPHLSYIEDEGEGKTLAKYAFYDGASWRVETVGGPGQFSRGGALAVDAMGRPHIVYRLTEGNALAYAYRAGSQWQVEVVDSERSVRHEQPALVLDAAGRPHVGYMAGYSLKYAWRRAAPVLPDSGGPSSVGWLLVGALALLGIGLAVRYAASRQRAP
jgi:hypothetical protein